jgi:uncharacterized protein YlxW (UPF0749 family)
MQTEPGRRNRAAALIGVLLASLGFALAVQLHSNASTDALSGAREDDLVRILDDQNTRQDRLRSQIEQLQTAKQRLSDSGSNNAAAREEAQRQADALAVLTGTAPAHGPGLDIVITDPDHQLRAEDLLDVVQELRGAGAEVIQFDSVRLGVNSAFGDTGRLVTVDETTLSAPYRVLAIGDPQTMDTALNIRNGVVATVRSFGGDISIRQKTALSITAVRRLSRPQFATPVPK